METRGRMVAHSWTRHGWAAGSAVALILALGSTCAPANARTAVSDSSHSSSPQSSSPQSSSSQQSPPQPGSSPADQPQEQSGSSSSQKSHGKTAHHVRVEEEGSAAPELEQAEALIQKHDYFAAEPLLRKALAGDASNYVAWFDLGFVENGLGKVDDSIAAYRKSVEAKPDVFESNLNLGLQLAKSGQPDAAQFLRAATQLKPTSHVAEGQARAWLSLAHVLEATKPEEAIAAYREAAV